MRILLAVDDSTFSEAATRAVIEQMKPDDSEVYVLHAFHPLTYLTEIGSQSVVESLKAIEGRRQAEAKELLVRTGQPLEKAGFKVKTVLMDTDPRDAIIDQAEKWKADLIVVGSHGWKGLDRLLIGSVAEHVARHANCSVEIVRLQAGKSGRESGRQ